MGNRMRLVLIGLAVLAVLLWLTQVGPDREDPAPPDDLPEVVDLEEPDLPEPPAEPEQEPAQASSGLRVRVLAGTDRGPIAGARVLVGEGHGVLVTDETGTAEIRDLPPGEVSVRARAAGFVRLAEALVTLVPSETAELEVLLTPGLLLEVLVLDKRDERPVPDAEVVLSPGGSAAGRAELSFEPELARGATGSDGSVRLAEAPEGELFTVVVRTKGYVTESRSVTMRPSEGPREPLELRLTACGTLRGTVLDPDGKPVPGARVYAIPGDAPDMLLDHPEREVFGSRGGHWVSLKAVSGEDGSFEITGLVLGGTYLLRAAAEGFALSEAVLDYRDVRLRGVAAAVVRVLTSDGAPVQKARGILISGTSHSILKLSEPGLFRIDPILPGRHQFQIHTDDHPLKIAEFEALAGQTVEIEIRLTAGLPIAGVVLDDLGKPVVGARVSASRPHGAGNRGLTPSEGKTQTDEAGSFRIAGGSAVSRAYGGREARRATERPRRDAPGPSGGRETARADPPAPHHDALEPRRLGRRHHRGEREGVRLERRADRTRGGARVRPRDLGEGRGVRDVRPASATTPRRDGGPRRNPARPRC